MIINSYYNYVTGLKFCTKCDLYLKNIHGISNDK